MATRRPPRSIPPTVGGYAILVAKSKEEAIEYGRRFLNVHAEVLGDSYEGELEIRQMAEGPQS
jgi:hypothetical protein